MATPRPTYRPKPRNSDGNRDSNALRASVLDAALEMGIGNKTVANWVFNSIDEDEEQEEEEEDAIAIPSLTTTGTATSDESYQIVYPSEFYSQSHTKNGDSMNGLAYSSQKGLTIDASNRFVHFDTFSERLHSTPAVNPVTTSTKHNKLKKARPDDYQNDGGYTSDRGGSRKDKKNKSKDKDGKLGYESEGDAIVAKKKKKIRTSKDGPKQSLDGEESDGGYLSEATRGRISFFRRNKSKNQNLQESGTIPPVPSSWSVSRPIADKFSGRSMTPNTFTSASNSVRTISPDTVDTSRSITPTTREPKHDYTVLTQAFKEDAYSVAGSVDWTHSYSHFPRPGRAPPISPTTFLSSSSHMKAPVMVSTSSRQSNLKPNVPVHLSVQSDYGHASQVSPVPSRAASIAPDPNFAETVQHNLLEATSEAPEISLQPSSRRPPPIKLSLSADYAVPSPLPSPGGTMRPRTLALYDLPPPSPPPSGPLPRLPAVPDANVSGMKPSKLGPSATPNPPQSSRSANPDVSTRWARSPINSAIGVDDKLQQFYDGRAGKVLSQSSLRNSSGSGREHRRGIHTSDTQSESVSDGGHSDVVSSAEVDSGLPVTPHHNSVPNRGNMSGHLNDQRHDDARGTRPLDWNRVGTMDGKTKETRTGSVKNLASMYDREGREKTVRAGGLPLTPKSILRHGLKT